MSSIDTFWEAYNASRCKTAMLVFSVIAFLGYVVSVLLEKKSDDLHLIVLALLGYWMGRASKARDPGGK